MALIRPIPITDAEISSATITLTSSSQSVNLGAAPTLLVVHTSQGDFIHYNGTNVETSSNFTITLTSTGFTYQYAGSGSISGTYYAV